MLFSLRYGINFYILLAQANFWGLMLLYYIWFNGPSSACPFHISGSNSNHWKARNSLHFRCCAFWFMLWNIFRLQNSHSTLHRTEKPVRQYAHSNACTAKWFWNICVLIDQLVRNVQHVWWGYFDSCEQTLLHFVPNLNLYFTLVTADLEFLFGLTTG